MSLRAWMDENDNLYVAGATGEYDAMTASIENCLKVANAHLNEVDDLLDYKRLEREDAHRFRTLWVDPAALDEETWSNDQWADATTPYEDREYTAKGWMPVLTVELVAQ